MENAPERFVLVVVLVLVLGFSGDFEEEDDDENEEDGAFKGFSHRLYQPQLRDVFGARLCSNGMCWNRGTERIWAGE